MRLGPGKKKKIPRVNIEIIVILTSVTPVAAGKAGEESD